MWVNSRLIPYARMKRWIFCRQRRQPAGMPSSYLISIKSFLKKQINGKNKQTKPDRSRWMVSKETDLDFQKMNSAVFGVRLTWLDLKTLWNIPRLYTFYYFSLTCKNNLGHSVIIDFVTVLVFVQFPSVHFNWLDSYPILSILLFGKTSVTSNYYC